MSDMKLAFIVDPLDKLKAYKDSSIAMMREAAARGHAVYAIQRPTLAARDGLVSARAQLLALAADDHDWYRVESETIAPLNASTRC